MRCKPVVLDCIPLKRKEKMIEKDSLETDYLLTHLKDAGCVVNRTDPDHTPRSGASEMSLHYLLRPVCPKKAQTLSTF